MHGFEPLWGVREATPLPQPGGAEGPDCTWWASRTPTRLPPFYPPTERAPNMCSQGPEGTKLPLGGGFRPMFQTIAAKAPMRTLSRSLQRRRPCRGWDTPRLSELSCPAREPENTAMGSQRCPPRRPKAWAEHGAPPETGTNGAASPPPLRELGHPAPSPPGPPREAGAHDPPKVSGVFLLPDSRGSPLCHRHLHNPLLLPEQVWSIPHPPPWLTQSQTGRLLLPPTPLRTGSGPSAPRSHRCSLAFTPL